MFFAFIIGLMIAGGSIFLSLVTHNWYIGFSLSTAMGAISFVMTSILRNFLLILKRKAEIKKEELQSRVVNELDQFSKIIALFGLPNIVTAIILYFKLYR